MPRIEHRQPVDGAGNARVFVSETERTGNNTAIPSTQSLRRRFAPRPPKPREKKILRIIAPTEGIVVEMRHNRPFAQLADGSGHPGPGFGLSLFIDNQWLPPAAG